MWLHSKQQQQKHPSFSGYDLTQYMKKRMSRIWSALPSQIYPELARLEAQGLVTHYVMEQQDHRPDKKVNEVLDTSAYLENVIG